MQIKENLIDLKTAMQMYTSGNEHLKKYVLSVYDEQELISFVFPKTFAAGVELAKHVDDDYESNVSVLNNALIHKDDVDGLNAFVQLLFLRNVYIKTHYGEWTPNWLDSTQPKFTIKRDCNAERCELNEQMKFCIMNLIHMPSSLSFPTNEIAMAFKDECYELLVKANKYI